MASLSADGARVEFLIERLPCRIGRGMDNDLVVANLDLSRNHAVIIRDISGQLRLIDENSTNGTFVNRHRIEGYSLLKENDIIHFGSAGFRVCLRLANRNGNLPFEDNHTMVMSDNMTLAGQFTPSEIAFDELLMGQGLSGVVQPIVDARTRQVVAYELLGRANHPNLPKSPIELFGLAETMDREIDLSLAFRDYGIKTFGPLLTDRPLFINVHPKETFSEIFFASLEQLRYVSPDRKIVLEIHESAVTDTAKLREFAKRLDKLDVRFAYDDFGAGQSRLLELADTPPHFVKFDMSLIRDLHKASERKRLLVGDLVKMVLTTGAIPLAEGVEAEEEAASCIEMGFQLIQGFHTGRPVAVESIRETLSLA